MLTVDCFLSCFQGNMDCLLFALALYDKLLTLYWNAISCTSILCYTKFCYTSTGMTHMLSSETSWGIPTLSLCPNESVRVCANPSGSALPSTWTQSSKNPYNSNTPTTNVGHGQQGGTHNATLNGRSDKEESTKLVLHSAALLDSKESQSSSTINNQYKC